MPLQPAACPGSGALCGRNSDMAGDFIATEATSLLHSR
jgi:hypothetical protein